MPLSQPFPGETEMAHRMRALDWSATPLGSPDTWPDPLKQTVKLCLTSRFPIVMYWLPDLAMLYNDGYVPFLGETKHPMFLGRPGIEAWQDIWDVIGPLFERVIQTGEATWAEDFPFFFARNLPREEVYVTYSIGPIALDNGQVGGFFCPCTEVTEKVVGARRLETLRRLGVDALVARTVTAACDQAVAVLGENPDDIPFAAIYLVDERLGAGELKSVGGFGGGPHSFPRSVTLTNGDDGERWPLPSVFRERRARDLTGLIDLGLPGGPWPEPADAAIVVPMRVPDGPSGLAILGVGPRRVLDTSYRTFMDLIAGHISTALANATAYESEQRRAEALADLDRAKTAFFSNVSHEFRTPLTLILGLIEQLQARGGESVGCSRSELDLLHRHGARLLKMVNTLLDFSRIDAGRIQARYERTDLAAYTADLASLFQSAIEQAGLLLVVQSELVPAATFVDQSMWEKVVLNLLSNAFKFTFQGTITVSLRQAGEHVELIVTDTGSGIPETELPRIFDRFQRVANARSRTFEGSGIGLALVAQLVKLHGGAVRVESRPGIGSRFTVSIPFGVAHLPADQVVDSPVVSVVSGHAAAYVEEALHWLSDLPAGAHTIPGSAGPGHGLHPLDPVPSGAPPVRPRILFADDNADMRYYMTRLLSEQYDVSAVEDGQAALVAARARPPDLVLADVMMPRLDGFELLKQLRADATLRTIPVILISARAGEEARVEGVEAGADDYVIKPFSTRELLARVGARLEISRVTRETLGWERELRRAAEEAEGMTRLHELSTRLLVQTELLPLLEEILDGSIELTNADFGNVQLRDDETGVLKIVAQRGLGQGFLDHFDSGQQGTGSCGTALARHERVIVRDVLGSPLFQTHLDVMTAAGVRAVQSTPLKGRGGEVLGIVSTHFRRPHHPTDRELRLLDLYARQASEMIAQKRADDALRASEERFRRYFELGLIGMATTSPTKGILEVNDELCRIFGYDREELLRKGWADLTHPDDVAADDEQFNRVLSGEIDGYALDKRWIRKDGSVIHSIMAARCLRRTDGTVDSFVGLVQDITARKRDEEELRRSEATLHKYHEDLLELTTRLIETQEVQSKHLARELHDVFSQQLAVIGMEIARIAHKPADSEAALFRLTDEIGTLARDIHRISRQLHPSILEDLGLVAAIRSECLAFTEQYGIHVDCAPDEIPRHIPEDVALALYRVAQESLRNIGRHAGASSVHVTLRSSPREIRLVIHDQGSGFDPQTSRSRHRLGLVSMEERLRIVGGVLSIHSEVGDGTRVTATVPIAL